jgi:O-antigen/teichoic acid export membrane protein
MFEIAKLSNILEQRLPALRLFIGSTGSLLIGFAAQALSFLVLAHYLGTVQFGQLVVITPVSALAAVWSGFGFNELLRRQVSRDPNAFSAALGHNLIMIFSTGTVLIIIFVVGMTLFLPVAADPRHNLQILVLLGISNILLTPIINLTESVFLAHEDFTRANVVSSGLGMARALTAVIACLVFGVTSLRYWVIWYTATHIILCLVCAVIIRRVGVPKWRILRAELPLGISFSLSNFLVMLRSNLDILVLAAVATPHFVGVYGVARRIVAVGLVVPGAFDRLIYGRLTAAGMGGPVATLRLAKKYLIISVSISTATSISIFILAALVPRLVGAEYAEAVGIVHILCWTLISTAIQFLAFDSLNAAELHRIAAIISGTTNAAGAAMVVWLGSAYGMTGLFISLYLSDIIRGAAMWTALEWMSRRQANPRV